MTKEEIKNEAMKACKDYGYEWVMAEFQYEDSDELIKDLKKEMKDKGHCQTQIFGGDEPYYALDDDELYDAMEEGEVFNEGNVYKWINLGRIDAWKDVLGMKKVGYFCDGYGGYVFDPKMMDVNSLKRKGEVVVG